MSDVVEVAVGVLRDEDGRVLLARRPPGVHLGGLWEFPGGKRAPGESRLGALARELREEIGVVVGAARPLIRIRHSYPEKTVELDVWLVQSWTGEPHGREGQQIEWTAQTTVAERDFPSADRAILAAIALPDTYLITPDPKGLNPADFLSRLSACVERGVRLIQVRGQGSRAELPADLLQQAGQICHRAGASLLVSSGLSPLGEATTDGIHLTSRHLMASRVRPSGFRLVGASCHNALELSHAAKLGLDFAVLGPVKPTRSHPGALPIGWPRFAALVEAADLPVYALGGVGPEDRSEAWERGGQGIAAIRSLWEGPEDGRPGTDGSEHLNPP